MGRATPPQTCRAPRAPHAAGRPACEYKVDDVTNAASVQIPFGKNRKIPFHKVKTSCRRAASVVSGGPISRLGRNRADVSEDNGGRV